MTVLLPLNAVTTSEAFRSPPLLSPHKRTSSLAPLPQTLHPIIPNSSSFLISLLPLPLLPFLTLLFPRCSCSPFSSPPPSPSSLRRPHRPSPSPSPPTPADEARKSSTRPPSGRPPKERSGRSAPNRSSHGTRPASPRGPREIRAPSCLATTTTPDLKI